MRTDEDKQRTFEKVGACLYRYKPTGMYYARIKRPGKELRRSLEPTDRATAKRKLNDLHKEIDRTEAATGRVTLADLCEHYMATVQTQRPKTLKRKRHIHARLLADFPGSADVPAGKVLPSQVSTWLASYKFGEASYNLFLEYVRALFALAVDDRIVAASPVAVPTVTHGGQTARTRRRDHAKTRAAAPTASPAQVEGSGTGTGMTASMVNVSALAPLPQE